MTRAQKRALEAHPDGYVEYVREKWVSGFGGRHLETKREGIGADNSHDRRVYIEGYLKAISDAADWLTIHTELDKFTIELFEQSIEEDEA